MKDKSHLELISKIDINNVNKLTISKLEDLVNELVKEIDFFGSKITIEKSKLVETSNNRVVNRKIVNGQNNEICAFLIQKATFDDSLNHKFHHGVGYKVETYLNSDLEIVSLAVRNFKGKIKYYLDNETVNKITFKNSLDKSLDKENLSGKKKIKL